jgi:hypothetical protein
MTRTTLASMADVSKASPAFARSLTVTKVKLRKTAAMRPRPMGFAAARANIFSPIKEVD